MAELEAALAQPARDRSCIEPETADLDTLLALHRAGEASPAEQGQLADWAEYLVGQLEEAQAALETR